SAEAWQFIQYWAKPILVMALEGAGGQSGSQPLPGPKPYQPQNQPSCDAAESLIMIAAPLEGCMCKGSTSVQAAAGVSNISLIIIAPSGIGGGLYTASLSPGRLATSQSAICGE